MSIESKINPNYIKIYKIKEYLSNFNIPFNNKAKRTELYNELIGQL
jgi:hypothetical protein